MGSYKEVEGDLIVNAKRGDYDVIAHGCNCMCTMGAGIAVQMAESFGCHKFPLEDREYYRDINKLGQIDYDSHLIKEGKIWEIGDFSTKNSAEGWKELNIVNAYTQYNYGKNHEDGEDQPLDYSALRLILRKMNHVFKGKHIGLPQIGCGLAGGNWNLVRLLIKETLSDCDVTVVIYEK